MLQNKLSSLEKFSNLEKLKILDLMCKQRERKFIKSITQSKLSNKVKWSKLATFLKNELNKKEAYILNDKVKKWNLDKNEVDEKTGGICNFGKGKPED